MTLNKTRYLLEFGINEVTDSKKENTDSEEEGNGQKLDKLGLLHVFFLFF